jgi:6-phosphogluconolactonase/glucosamine-6-phosphate isomerase/deaminase
MPAMIYTKRDMTFRKITSAEPVVSYLVKVLREKLAAGERVLWLVPGGSAIDVAATVSQQLRGTDLSNLTVTLTDERFGPVGHDDSNWRQLHDADFHLPGATMVPVLHGHSQTGTTQEFARHLQEYCRGASYCIGFFGIGPDGHTAGILPGSPAVNAKEWAVIYQAPGFTRVTMTPPAIAALSEAVVYAMGESKQEPLELLQQDVPIDKEPAQALKKVPKLTIFNDQIGDPT